VVGENTNHRENSNQQPAGPIIIKRGLDNFEKMYQGWKLAALVT
jgi:hypothetical protein